MQYIAPAVCLMAGLAAGALARIVPVRRGEPPRFELRR